MSEDSIRQAKISRFKKAVFILSGILGLLITLAFAAYWMDGRHFHDSVSLPSIPKPASIPSENKVALIGDSWLAGNELGLMIEQAFPAEAPVEVSSMGISGARSRVILKRMLEAEQEGDVFFPLMKGTESFPYSVIVLGVNDSIRYLGPDFYSHHVLQIVRILNHRNSYPIIMEMPEYAVEDADPQNVILLLRRRLFRYLYDDNQSNNLAAYRSKLKSTLQAEKDLTYSIVSFSEVTRDFNQVEDLYSPDKIHLNQNGLQQLARVLAKELYQHIND